MNQGIITDQEIKENFVKYTNELEEAYVISKQENFDIKDWKSVAFETLHPPDKFGPVKDTCVPVNILQDLG